MPPDAVRLTGLSKRYVIEEDRAQTLKEKTLGLFKTRRHEEIEALSPLDLTVPRGQTLGIIGQNGAGKSTLLKLISGVTTPTAGAVQVDGSLLALIELGAGFQPELSGLDNVFINGLILGLSEKQVQALLPSIIEFSGLEEFMVTPLKHYSSGMVLRLGFSIAAHIEPDVILIDENLSVGDLYFQAKCVAKLREMKKRGKTILIVTHSLDVAEMLCDRIVWLRQGKVAGLGEPNETIKRYEQSVAQMDLMEWSGDVRRHQVHASTSGRFGTGEARIVEFLLRDAEGRPCHVFGEGDAMTAEIVLQSEREIPNLNAEVGVLREDGLAVFNFNATDDGVAIHLHPGRSVIRIVLDSLLIRPGRFSVTVAISPDNNPDHFYDFHKELYQFRVEQRYETQLKSAVRVPCEISVRPMAP